MASKQVDHHATAIGLIRLDDGTLIGAESRLNDTITVGGVNIKILDSDTELKIKKVTTNVVISASGSKSRYDLLRKYLKEKVDAEGDVTSVLNQVGTFLRENKLPRSSSPLSVFVVGYEKDNEKCFNFVTGDEYNEPKLISDTFYAIGGGKSAVSRHLRKCQSLKSNTPIEEAKDYLLHALLKSSIVNVNCGGLLRVWWVSRKEVKELTPAEGLHTMDAIQHFKYVFYPRNEIFVYDRNSYKEMNYYFLEDCLNGLGLKPAHVACLGYLKDEGNKWKMFLVQFENAADVERVLKVAPQVASRATVRKLTYGENVKMVLLRASGENFVNARTAEYLEELQIYL